MRDNLCELALRQPALQLANRPFYAVTALLVAAAYGISILVPSIYVRSYTLCPCKAVCSHALLRAGCFAAMCWHLQDSCVLKYACPPPALLLTAAVL